MLLCLAWWLRPIIPARRKQRQENWELQASLSLLCETLSQKEATNPPHVSHPRVVQLDFFFINIFFMVLGFELSTERLPGRHSMT
jgi:hypothetical protein